MEHTRIEAVSPAHRASLRDLLQRRGIDRIAYFHTDHFEPWRVYRGLSEYDATRRNLDAILDFSDRMARLPHARRLTLFYLSRLGLLRNPDPNSPDPAILVPRDPAIGQLVADGFRAAHPGFEYQLHLHHEVMTWHPELAVRHPMRRLFEQPDRERDARMFDLMLAESLDRLAADTGARIDRWFFIHGVWALNASEPSMCAITDEIIRLRRAGCLGDFTFPAARPMCNPRYDRPMSIRPFDAPKCYDQPDADAIPVHEGAGDPDRFMIWSSRMSTDEASLDYHTTPRVAANFASTGAWAGRLVRDAFQRGGTLYLKTHAHVMIGEGFDLDTGKRLTPFPHEHDGVKRLFGLLEDAMARLSGRVDYITASEAHDELTRPPEAADEVYGYRVDDDGPSRLAVQRTEDVVLPAVAARVAAIGEGAGLNAHFTGQLDRRVFTRQIETELATLIERHAVGVEGITCVRSTIGVVPLVAANVTDRPVISLENNQPLFDTQQAVIDAAVLADPALAGRITLLRKSINGVRDRVLRHVCVVFVDCGGKMDDGQRRAVIARLRHADVVIFDALRFFRKIGPGEVDALLDLFEAEGFPRPRLAVDLGPEAQFHVVDNRARSRGALGVLRWLTRKLRKAGS